jgi:uncharacterized membrane protein YqaE (UPF0057 family)
VRNEPRQSKDSVGVRKLTPTSLPSAALKNKKKTIPAKLRITLTAAYLLCIYSTLSIARPIVNYLRSAGILLPTIIFLFAIVTPPALFWRYRTISRKQFFLRISLIILLLCSAFLISALPEERLHFIIYGLLGWLICWSLEPASQNFDHPENSSKKIKIMLAWLLPCLLVWLAGGIDELIQWRLPTRVFDIRDIIFNGVAGMMGIAIFATGGKGNDGDEGIQNLQETV